MKRLILWLATCSTVLTICPQLADGQSRDLFIPGLPILQLGASKAEVMGNISDDFVVRRLGTRTAPPGPLVDPKSEASGQNPDSDWFVYRKDSSREPAPVGDITFSKGRLSDAERFFPGAHGEEVMGFIKDLFALLREETGDVGVVAVVTATSEDQGRLIRRKITINFAGRETVLAMIEGEGGDGNKYGQVSISKQISSSSRAQK
jgi:hypothetical protein